MVHWAVCYCCFFFESASLASTSVSCGKIAAVYSVHVHYTAYIIQQLQTNQNTVVIAIFEELRCFGANCGRHISSQAVCMQHCLTLTSCWSTIWCFQLLCFMLLWLHSRFSHGGPCCLPWSQDSIANCSGLRFGSKSNAWCWAQTVHTLISHCITVPNSS